MSDLATDTKLLVDLVNGLDATVTSMTIDLEPDLICWTMIEDANRTLSSIRHTLTNRLAKAMPDKQMTIEGVGTFLKHAKKDRTSWDKDDLLRAVLDTRLVDPSTGEIIDETPLSKVLNVWNLSAPRLTALRERGIDPDEYCHAEWAGFSLEIKA